MHGNSAAEDDPFALDRMAPMLMPAALPRSGFRPSVAVRLSCVLAAFLAASCTGELPPPVRDLGTLDLEVRAFAAYSGPSGAYAGSETYQYVLEMTLTNGDALPSLVDVHPSLDGKDAKWRGRLALHSDGQGFDTIPPHGRLRLTVFSGKDTPSVLPDQPGRSPALSVFVRRRLDGRDVTAILKGRLPRVSSLPRYSPGEQDTEEGGEVIPLTFDDLW